MRNVKLLGAAIVNCLLCAKNGRFTPLFTWPNSVYHYKQLTFEANY